MYETDIKIAALLRIHGKEAVYEILQPLIEEDTEDPKTIIMFEKMMNKYRLSVKDFIQITSSSVAGRIFPEIFNWSTTHISLKIDNNSHYTLCKRRLQKILYCMKNRIPQLEKQKG